MNVMRGIERNGMFILNPNYGELDNQMWKSVEKQTSRLGINWFSDY
jgi:hypothetical protein|uniref:Uncharacterized protein n=1 Tax=Citrobacter freundii TaxID=546 RepID=A0A2R4AK44_CITFR|nr:hypothetical protein [Citrobacter freundii]